MIILLLGPQGAGKGTQGERLSAVLGYPLVGAGALLREEQLSGSDLGERIGAIIDAGNLVPADLITEMLGKRLQRADAKAGVLIDGYPRDTEQLRLMFERFIPDLVLVLELDDQTAIERLGGRWMCPKDHIYNLQSNPPKKAGVCNEDGTALFQRVDDQEAAIKKRLAIYHADTAPLIAQIEERGVRVERINAALDIEVVYRAILAVIKKEATLVS
ncbi:TPA: adenylate kinase [Candidatus Uhrbacteria bacterium]|nr:adenylate kinase [Candidatus Uhrbacteria bacterium]